MSLYTAYYCEFLCAFICIVLCDYLARIIICKSPLTICLTFVGYPTYFFLVLGWCVHFFFFFFYTPIQSPLIYLKVINDLIDNIISNLRLIFRNSMVVYSFWGLFFEIVWLFIFFIFWFYVYDQNGQININKTCAW